MPRGLATLGSWLVVPLVQAVNFQECPVRTCLPTDDTQWPPICFSETEAPPPALTRRQSFASCPKSHPYCSYCVEEPPCESRCSDQSEVRRPLGSACTFHEQCGGQFAKCLQGVCRRALHTHQACSLDDPNDVCVFGQRSCFRGKCQGLRSGDACSWQPEGRDIDCKPGWYCFLGVCAPQLPDGHTCAGQHPRECVRECRCNMALDSPKCVRQYTLDLGATSGDVTLCKSNHIDPERKVCALEPEILYHLGQPVVKGVDCTDDSECPRADGSLGVCACKRWFSEDGGTPGYCELYVPSSGRPSFKRFWMSQVLDCHHDWSEERCAAELGLEDVLADINQEIVESSSDPTRVQQCGKLLMADSYITVKGTGLQHRTSPVVAAVIGALAMGRVVA